jgi:hypothetical protein
MQLITRAWAPRNVEDTARGTVRTCHKLLDQKRVSDHDGQRISLMIGRVGQSHFLCKDRVRWSFAAENTAARP